MKKTIFLTIVVTIVFMHLPKLTNAQRVYIGADLMNIDYSDSDDFDYKLKAINVKMGSLFTPYFALEGRYAFGVNKDMVNYLGFDVEIELDELFGIYTLLILPDLGKIKPYAILGYTWSKETGDIDGLGISVIARDEDLSYGLGLEFTLNDHICAIAEYIILMDRIDYDYSGLSFGLKFYF